MDRFFWMCLGIVKVFEIVIHLINVRKKSNNVLYKKINFLFYNDLFI
jgi:hypothetical protein